MKYPLVQFYDILTGRPYHRRLKSHEYDARIQHFRNYLKAHKNDGTEYVQYLEYWFGNHRCHGLPSFKMRHSLHMLPMTSEEFDASEEDWYK